MKLTDQELRKLRNAYNVQKKTQARRKPDRNGHRIQVTMTFEEWLQVHFPDRAAHVMSLIRQSRGGKNYDSRFGSRMRGEGQFADLLEQRFRLARRKLGLDRRGSVVLDCSQFCPPGAQLSLL